MERGRGGRRRSEQGRRRGRGGEAVEGEKGGRDRVGPGRRRI